MAPAPMAQGAKLPKADLTFIIPADSVRILELTVTHVLFDRLRLVVLYSCGKSYKCGKLLSCTLLIVAVVCRQISQRRAHLC